MRNALSIKAHYNELCLSLAFKSFLGGKIVSMYLLITRD